MNRAERFEKRRKQQKRERQQLHKEVERRKAQAKFNEEWRRSGMPLDVFTLDKLFRR